jgi:hypothetical protein
VRSVPNHTVPRGSVYNAYQFCCGDCRIPTLNPASFGKLVRVVFPGVATRRLGNRGNSKYHYVGLTLLVDKCKQDGARRGGSGLIHEDSNQNELNQQPDSRYACFINIYHNANFE